MRAGTGTGFEGGWENGGMGKGDGRVRWKRKGGRCLRGIWSQWEGGKSKRQRGKEKETSARAAFPPSSTSPAA